MSFSKAARKRGAGAERAGPHGAAQYGPSRNWIGTIHVDTLHHDAVINCARTGDLGALLRLFQGSLPGDESFESVGLRTGGQVEFNPGDPAHCHLQVYLRYSRPVRPGFAARQWTFIGDGVCRAHVTKREWGSDELALNYCTREDKRFPGTLPFVSAEPPVARQGARSDLEEGCQELLAHRDLAALAVARPGTFVKHHAGYAKLLEVTAKSRKDGPRIVIWFYGSSGAGKSCLAGRVGEFYFHRDSECERGYDAGTDVARVSFNNDGGFLNGYRGEEHIALFDDFAHELPTRSQQNWARFMDLIGMSSNPVNVKGGYKRWNVDVVLITNKRPPHECLRPQLGWDADREKFELLRRLTYIVKCNGEFETPTWYDPLLLNASSDDAELGPQHVAASIPEGLAQLTPRVMPPLHQEMASDDEAPEFSDREVEEMVVPDSQDL